MKRIINNQSGIVHHLGMVVLAVGTILALGGAGYYVYNKQQSTQDSALSSQQNEIPANQTPETNNDSTGGVETED